MKNCIIIFLKDEVNIQVKNHIVDFFKGMLGNVEHEFGEEIVIKFNKSEDVDFSDIAQMIINDFGVNITLFEIDGPADIELINTIINLVNQNDIQKNYIELKKFLLFTSKVENECIKKNILKKYYNDQEMLNVVKVFLENNSNTSLAATKLYLHRNTLINKIDKFINITGYDIKTFSDAFVVYQLLN